MMNNTVIIIGGTFNPITNAHLQMGISLRKRYPSSDIVYVPSNLKFISAWKNIEDSDVFCDTNRIRLLKNVLNTYGFKMSSVEVNGDVNGSTYDTVQYFKRTYENVIVAIGADKIQELDRWDSIDKLLEIARLVVFNRGRESIEDLMSDYIKTYRDRINIIEISGMDNVSSTSIRNAFKNGTLDEIKETIPCEVYNFLEKERHRYV